MTQAAANLRVLIVDDEPLAREGLKLLLLQESGVAVAGECKNGAEAIQAIQKLRPDLLFLDVKMPRVTGFDVIEAIGPENMPPVIFITAFDEHAVKAFQVNAMDYLLKPISPEQLRDSLNRARTRIRNKTLAERAQEFRALLNMDASSQPSDNGRIQVRSSGHVYFLRPAQILWIEASGDYVVIHIDDRTHLIRDTMQNMEQRLSSFGFKRIHRSAIVNLEYVSELIANDSGDYEVILTNGNALKLSRSYRDEMYAALKA